MSAILSFVTGSALRAIWGETVAFLNRRADHKHELERAEQQERFAAAQHARNLAAIEQQHKLQVDVVRVKGEADVATADAAGYWAARSADEALSGIAWVDAFNKCIRPLGAIVALGVWVLSLWARKGQATDWDWELVALILGYYYADRSLSKRGK